MRELTLEGARVILGQEIVETPVSVAEGRIALGAASARRIDARGLILAPAMIDAHGDAFERQLMPRPGVFFPLDTAILETDRQLAANGIATSYHAVTLGWEPGLRDLARNRDYLSRLAALSPRLVVDNRVQLRWETFAFEAIGLIEATLGGPLTPSIAFNDHTSMTMRAFGVSIQDRDFELSPDFAIAALDDARMSARITAKAERSGMDEAEYRALLGRIWDRRPEVEGAIRRVAALGRAAGAPMLSHDDTRARTRAFFRDIGARVAEFPMTLEPVEDARAQDDAIVFGAPNVVRGGSHIGSLDAADMVEAGQCDALASDYYYPALLAAVDRLHRERRAPLPALWSLVSEGPARAMGLTDRGRIAEGLRADLVLLDWPEGEAPRVVATWVAGRLAHASARAGLWQ